MKRCQNCEKKFKFIHTNGLCVKCNEKMTGYEEEYCCEDTMDILEEELYD